MAGGRFFKIHAGPGSSRTPENRSWHSVRLLAPYFRSNGLQVAAGFLALIVVDLFNLTIPRVIKWAVDSLQNGTATPGSLAKNGLTVIGIAIAIATFRYFWRRLILGFSRILETGLRNRMFAHVLTLDKAFFQRTTAGEIMALATNDLSAVQLASGMGLVAFFDAVFMGVAAFAFMAYIDPWLTLVAVAPMPILAITTRVLSSRLHHRFKKVQEQFSMLTEFARSTFSSIRLFKAYGQEEAQSKRFEKMGQTYVRDNLRLAAVYGALFPISAFMGNIGMLLVLLYGGRLTVTGRITAGDFVAFINYLFLMIWPMMAMGWVADLFQRGATSLSRIEELLDEKPCLGDPPNPLPGVIKRGEIAIRNLSFYYPGQNEPALDAINLDIAPGAFIGVVGRIGSGKTTLCHLLARLYPVEDKTLLYDGADVNAIPIAEVRRAIAYVPQDVVLFSETIAFNISLGNPAATQGEIEEAARAASIHEEIAAMKEGYGTMIGERGVKLSGGQRQRIAIARALLLDRPIIIIDDALSAVDMETEHAILSSIASYLKGRTCVVVSHRVAPLADAHEIIVMDSGRIVARGPHEQLLTRSGFYATIYRQQTTA